jgi:hypothetical protein
VPLPDGFVSPSYGTGSLAAVLPAVAGALGVSATTATGLVAAECQRALALPGAERAVVVLCDGLGLTNLTDRAGHAPFFRVLLPDTRALTTSFPATTAAAMSVFGTGTTPGRTGILGYTQRNPATGGLAAMLSWTEQANPRNAAEPDAHTTAVEVGVAPEALQREPTVFEAAVAAGVPATMVGPAKFAGSGLTRASLRGAQFVAVQRPADRAEAVARMLRNPGLLYLYWGEVDAAGHTYGPESAEWGRALEEFDREFARLLRTVPRGTLVVLTADHGQIEADLPRQIDIATTPVLSAGVDLVAGEPRALHVFTAEQASAVADRWRDYLGDRAGVALRDEAIGAGWFGPVADHVRAWIGDIIVAPAGRLTIVDSRTLTAAALGLRGVHGSMTAEEMTIPVLAITGG